MRYPLENIEVQLGHKLVKINAYADYELESDSCHFARFTKVKIVDWDYKCHNAKDAMQGLTKNDLKALSDSILDNLNENFELCDYLARKYLS